jgi:hypothetical protein
VTRDPDLGNVFLDVAFTGVVLMTVALVVDVARGGGAELGLVGLCLAVYGVFVIGALRAGASPLRYLRTVAKRGSMPR